MFLRSILRKKNGKEHESFSIVENKRVAGGKVVQRHVLYLGEINSTQQEAWRRTIEIFEDGGLQPKTVALFPEDRAVALSSEEIVRIRLKDLQLKRPRQWGACWLATVLYEKLELDRFWAEKLPPNRKGTHWDLVLQTLITYRLLDPGSEWKLHRSGSKPRRWAICWERILAWWTVTNSTNVWTCCSSTSGRSLIT